MVYNDERKNMKNLFLTTVAVFGLTGAVYAADVTGSVEMEVAKASDGVYAITPTLTLDFGTTIALLARNAFVSCISCVPATLVYSVVDVYLR